MVWTEEVTASFAAGVRRAEFGRMPSGEIVESVEIANASGMRLRVLSYGATIQTLEVPDRHGQSSNVVLNYAELQPYLARPEFFGAAIGRYANRIAGGGFMLDGQRHTLSTNEGANTLHGGPGGFHHVLWRIDAARGGDAPCVQLSYRSPDGDQGFPGELDVRIIYALDADNTLRVTFEATTDKPTVVSLTSHPYFNLAGAGSGADIRGHHVELAADAYTPIDASGVPTGELRPVEGTPFDFRTPTVLDEPLRRTHDPELGPLGGFDHNFALRGGITAEPKLAARVTEPSRGRALELLTTEPGLQFYTGQKLGRADAATRALYQPYEGFAMEPQFFPDSPNRPEFPSTRLDPGRTYRHVSLYRFSVT